MILPTPGEEGVPMLAIEGEDPDAFKKSKIEA
jgi:hypothetical protein